MSPLSRCGLPHGLQEEGVRPWGCPVPRDLDEAGAVWWTTTDTALSLMLGKGQGVLLEDLAHLLVKEREKVSGQRASEMVTSTGAARGRKDREQSPQAVTLSQGLVGHHESLTWASPAGHRPWVAA